MIGACVLYVSWCFGFCHRSVAKMSARAYLEALRDEIDNFIATVETSKSELELMDAAVLTVHECFAIAGGITGDTETNRFNKAACGGFNVYVFWVLLTRKTT